MTSRPIILNGPEVRAVLDGRKTHHCVVLRPQPAYDFDVEPLSHRFGFDWARIPGPGSPRPHERWPVARIPLAFAPGDKLWVRETWAHDAPVPPQYKAGPHVGDDALGVSWRSPVTMPRWASRLTLTVEAVRVFRVQEISEKDARAEGARGNAGGAWGCEGLIEDFADLWNARHGADAWDRNAWVAGITFTAHRCNVDQMP